MRACESALVLLLLVLPGVATAQTTGLTGGPHLLRVYDAIFDARFEQVPALLTQACGPSSPDASDRPPNGTAEARSATAAPEVCHLLEVVSLWWQIQLDPKNRVHDDEFRTKSNAIIADIEAWTEREPSRGEAWFYLGGAYGARAQFRVLREERLAAARDGKRIKNALEQALALAPSLNDAYFGIGLYHYYADVAPAAFRMLRWVLLLPGGDRLEGMREMLRARSDGQLLQSEADYQLHLIYLWYEKQPQRALQLLRGLRDRHPGNPLFVQQIAEIQDVYLHDLQASRQTWEALLESAETRRVAQPAITEATARLALAGVLDRLSEGDTAMQHLRAIIEMKPPGPYGVLARAHLKLGQVLDRAGRRDEALRSYRAALDVVPPDDPDGVVRAARAGMRGR